MSNELTLFDFQEKEVRVIAHEGEPWFVAADVCKILELKNVTEVLKGLNDDEKYTLRDPEGILPIKKDDRAQQINLVNEPGLYRLIFKSRTKGAKAFQDYVFRVILPRWRKSIMYLNEENLKRIENAPDPKEEALVVADYYASVNHKLLVKSNNDKKLLEESENNYDELYAAYKQLKRENNRLKYKVNKQAFLNAEEDDY